MKRLIDGDGEVLLYVLKLYTEGGIPGVGKPLHIERRANMCWPNIGEQVTGKATPTPWLERRGAHSQSSPGGGGPGNIDISSVISPLAAVFRVRFCEY